MSSSRIFFRKRVPVDAEDFGGAHLIALRRAQRQRDQRQFDLLQNPVIEAGRRRAGLVALEELRRCRSTAADSVSAS